MRKLYLGLDAGSTYLKATLLEGCEVLGARYLPTGADCERTAGKLVDEICQEAGIHRQEIASVTATGYSRRSIGLADGTVSEISAHAAGIRITAPEGIHPRLLIDIGGQDSKIISLDPEGYVVNFTMNDKCAAGTGKFLEAVAELLETTMEEMPLLAGQSEHPCPINSNCAVFAQTEVISLLAQKKDRRDILAGMHQSMASRIAKMARKYKAEGDVLMTGGGAKNGALRMALEDELMCGIHTAEYPQYNGAIGAALIGCARSEGEL